jgi:homoserine kinase type II
MSVFTPIEWDELVSFLGGYDLGELVEYQGISAGVSNTNFFVSTELGRYVLTLFEKESHDELPFFIDLMAHLADHGIPCAHPIADEQGVYLQTLKDKPAVLVQRLQGAFPESPNLQQCHAIGAGLGSMHKASSHFTQRRANGRGPAWWRRTAKEVMPHLDADDAALLEDEVSFQLQHRHDDLPRGIIHADLFRDNTLFEDNRLSGIIDLYYACYDVMLYDVAITANDWCTDDNGVLDMPRLEAMLSAYNENRPLHPAEQDAWPVMLRAAALRFWLSRLEDMHFPREGEMIHIKDPDEFKRILIDRRDKAEELHDHWV